MQNEAKTVVGVFEDYSAAENVARELENAGIPRQSIEVKSNFMTGAAGRSLDREEHEEHHEGGISGFFHRLFGGGDDDRTEGDYAEAVRRGNSVVAVTAPDSQIDRIADIMNSAGAVDVDRHVEHYRESSGYERHNPRAEPYSYDEAQNERKRFQERQEGATIPVVEEELQVGKRVVRRGGVRVYSQVVDRPVEESVTLREEHVRVERRPVDRPLSTEDTQRLRNQSIEVTEMAEEPVISKRARVREEVVVGKQATERTENIRENVRRTEVKVEPLAGSGDYASDFRRDWQERYANSGHGYETYQPAYEYGYRSASDSRYRNRNWSDVEQDLRTDYMRNNPNSSWDRVQGAVRYGWEKVTGKR